MVKPKIRLFLIKRSSNNKSNKIDITNKINNNHNYNSLVGLFRRNFIERLQHNYMRKVQ